MPPNLASRLLLPVLLLALLPGTVVAQADEAGAGEAGVDAPQTAAPRPDARREPLQVPAGCLGTQFDDPRWFDRAQGYFSQRACTPAVWFDRFFGDEHAGDAASALVKVIPSVQYSDRDFTDSSVRLKARVTLPRMRDRLSLVINDDTSESLGLLPGEEARPAQVSEPGQESSAALRYLYRTAKQSGIDFDIGLRSEARFFARARYFKGWTHSPVLQSRFTESLWFRDPIGFGSTTLYELERMIAEDMLVRWSTQAEVSEDVNGLEVREGIQLLRQIDRDRAISWSLAMTVASDPVWQANSYSTSVRYRQRAFRPWFFFEVEPFIDASRDDGFVTNPGIAFRVEFWLGDSRGNSGIEQVGTPRRAKPPAVSPSSTSDAPTGAP